MKKILSNKWVHILLFLSIFVNVFLVGFIVSREGMVFDRPDRKGHGMSYLASLSRYLPQEQRREFFYNLRNQREEFGATKRQVTAINREIIELLKADQVDEEKLDELLRRERELHLTQISRFQESLIRELVELPAEERRELLEEARRNFEERRREHPDWGRGPHPDDMPPPPPPPPGE